MPDVILRVLSIVGIGLLCLAGAALLLLLLVLFWPVAYRVKGEKGAGSLTAAAGADWLFGLIRARYAYPHPGSVTVKFLWMTLPGTGSPGKTSEPKSGGKAAGEAEGEGEREIAREAGEKPAQEADRERTAAGQEDENGADLGKIQKIRYTILKTYDKIKEVWENISYYSALLQEEETALLWDHVKLRLGRVLKNIRPRRIRANVLFGTGSPDTTGYAFGLYGMLLPALGGKVCVTPDFERAVLEGYIDVSGHITLWILIWNTAKLFLDKKLRRFVKKMKAGRKKHGR